jgi:hypothetical protein
LSSSCILNKETRKVIHKFTAPSLEDVLRR